MDVLKGAAIVYGLVKKVSENYPRVQVGKTSLQGMMYLIGRELKENLYFSMYHFGPNSSFVSYCLNLAESLGALDVSFVENKGYFIRPKTTGLEIRKQLEECLEKNEKDVIEHVARHYGKFGPQRIKIIASAFYVEENFGIRGETLVDIISKITEQPNKCISKILSEVKLS